MSIPLSPELYHALLFQANISIYSGLAAMTALAYDILISFNLEVEVIWKASWTLPKCFYLLCRYSGLIGMIANALEVAGTPSSNQFCHYIVLSRYGLLVLSALGVELILMVRIYALYRGNKPVLMFTGLVALTLGGISFILLALFLKGQTHKAYQGVGKSTTSQPFPGCYSLDTSSNSFSKLFWIPPLICESYMFLLTLIKLFQSVRGARRSDGSAFQGHTLLFKTFYRDGSIYFAIIFVSLLFKVLITNSLSSDFLSSIMTGWTPAIFSIAGPRLVLNLRSANKIEGAGVASDTDSSDDSRDMRVESMFVAAAVGSRRSSFEV